MIDVFMHAVNFVIHVDQYLQTFVTWGGNWFYIVLFVIMFCETGLVMCPFLPGDSLLFATGAIAATATLNIHILAVSLTIAAILGDATNYAIGHWFGPKMFKSPNHCWLKPQHLDHTHHFFERYGNKTIVIARFVPIVRTVAPFVAGLGRMHYVRFAQYNVIGALLWINLFLYMSFYFGNLPVVKNNFSLVIVMIIILSILPAIIEIMKARMVKVACSDKDGQ